jgi:hypothetical protein
MKTNNLLPLETQVRVVAVCRKTGNTISEKQMTLVEWQNLKKKKEYYYKSYGI